MGTVDPRLRATKEIVTQSDMCIRHRQSNFRRPGDAAQPLPDTGHRQTRAYGHTMPEKGEALKYDTIDLDS